MGEDKIFTSAGGGGCVMHYIITLETGYLKNTVQVFCLMRHSGEWMEGQISFSGLYESDVVRRKRGIMGNLFF